MKKFIIGALLLLIGIPGFSFNFSNFLSFLAGLIPVLMILGGAIAVYLGFKELKQSDNSDTQDHLELTDSPQEELDQESSESSEDNAGPVPDTQQETQEAGSPPSASVSQATEAPAPEETAPSGASVQYKGNVETMVFHDVACNFATGKNCNMDFTTKEEAEGQGYKPCKICMPDD